MTIHPEYKANQKEYLPELANQLDLTGEHREIFLYRFDEDNHNKYKSNSNFVESEDFCKKLGINDLAKRKAKTDIIKSKFDSLRRDKIIKSLKQNSYFEKFYTESELEDFAKSYKNLSQFIFNDYFEIWLKERKSIRDRDSDIWNKIWEFVTDSEKIKLVKFGVEGSLKLKSRVKNEDTITKFYDDDLLYIQIDPPQEGYLTLIHKDNDGDYSLLSTSGVIKDCYCSEETITIPDEYSKPPYIDFDKGYTGKEQLIAIISEEEPKLDWLLSSKENDDYFSIDANNLRDLLDFVSEDRSLTVLGTEYTIALR